MTPLAGQAAVIGVGASSFVRRPDTSVLEPAGAALTAALADAATSAAAAARP
jgi:hypothetical protein